MGARNECGYQVLPAAAGARPASLSIPNSSWSERMLAAVAPRPWIRISVATACSGEGPAVRRGWSAWGSSVGSVFMLLHQYSLAPVLGGEGRVRGRLAS